MPSAQTTRTLNSQAQRCPACQNVLTPQNEARTCECGEPACMMCSYTCGCGDMMCRSCRIRCNGCGTYHCADCTFLEEADNEHYCSAPCSPYRECANCGSRVMAGDMRYCEMCSNEDRFCEDCYNVCRCCNNTVCLEHSSSCGECGNATCENCVSTNPETGDSECSHCAQHRAQEREDETLPVQTDLEATMREQRWKTYDFPAIRKSILKCCKPIFIYNPPPQEGRGLAINWETAGGQIHNYSLKPSNWPMFKMPWENTLYLGMEWELNFQPHKWEKINNITDCHIHGTYIWKNDSSIGHGAELVLAPRTLQSYHTINLQGLCNDLHAAGARGYNAGTCGIHVHVNKDGFPINNMKKIMAFFIANKTFIRKFAKRETDSLSHYAAIPTDLEHWFDGSVIYRNRHVAINSTNQTWEFRVFRSTTKYRRIKATLEFVDAIINFSNDVGTASMFYGNSLKDFRSWLSMNCQYQYLYSYLIEENLLPEL